MPRNAALENLSHEERLTMGEHGAILPGDPEKRKKESKKDGFLFFEGFKC